MKQYLHIALLLTLVFVIAQNAMPANEPQLYSLGKKYGKKNLVKNPHFSDSLKHYNSHYREYKRGGVQEGTYVITKDPKWNMNKYASQIDHTQDSAALMFFVNSSTKANDTSIILEQTIENVHKGMNYFLHFWASPNSEKNISVFRVKVNEKVVYDSLRIIYFGNGVWVRHEVLINALESDSIHFSFYTLLKDRVGNDLSLDDFYVSRLCDDEFDIADSLVKCFGEPISYKFSIPNQPINYRFEWEWDADLNIKDKFSPIFLNNESKYFRFKIYDDYYHCEYEDSILVKVIKEINVSGIEASPSAVIYPCKEVKLSVPDGYKYLWNTGETTNTITVTQAGEYKVRVSASENCYKDFRISVESFIPDLSFSIDSISAKSGEQLRIPIRYTFNNFDLAACDNMFLSVYLKYAKSLFLPNDLKKYRYKDLGKYEVLRINLPKLSEKENVYYLSGTALFGEFECTDIEVSPANECMKEYKSEYKHGKLCLSDICKEPTVRLITDAPKPKASHKVAGDNLIIEYEFPNNNTREVKLFDEMGRIVASTTISQSKGEATIRISALPIGIYFYEISNDKSLRDRFIIVR